MDQWEVVFERGWDAQSVNFWIAVLAVPAGAATAAAQKERICSEELGISAAQILHQSRLSLDILDML